MRPLGLILWSLIALATALCAKPTLWIIGDSTVRNGTAGQMGWGDPIVREFDPARIEVVNRAIGGRSSRSFLTEGRWDAILPHIKPGDFLLMQFGHNDGGDLFTGDRPRASLKGNGNNTRKGTVEATGKRETVYSFGGYLRKYASEASSRGATPIIVSLIPRNNWKDGKIGRSDNDYALWARQAAADTRSHFIDLNSILADAYQAMGPEKTTAHFASPDHTHTNPDGAAFNAATLAAAIRTLPDCKLSAALLPADLWLPSVFSDHMVLQRDMPVPIWGTARPGASVNIAFPGKTITTTAAGDGSWKTELPPSPAGGPVTMEVSSSGAKRIYQDILVGEVWLCSGQSNMDFTLASTPRRSFAGVTEWKKTVAAANHPQLRMFTAEWTLREFPQREIAGKWRPCTPATAGDFSAVAYYYGLALQQNLKVPVGLVTCAFGASTIEAWIRTETLRTHPQFKGLLDAYGKKATTFRDDPKLFADYGKSLASWRSGRKPAHPDPVQDQHNPSVLHNGMIAPIIPYAIRGAIWYQGESNLNTTNIYPDLQRALVEDWRTLWNIPDMPFYFVQLAAYRAPSDEPAPGGQFTRMREAQAKCLAIPHTGMAVTIDIGDEKDVHPRNKLDVGKRLARLALANTYQIPGVPCGPLFREASVEGSRIRIHFDHINGGLSSKSSPLSGFAIAGTDCRFVHADASTDGQTVTVSNPQVSNPAYVRYAWADNPSKANLYNVDGLPAAPFRTDP